MFSYCILHLICRCVPTYQDVTEWPLSLKVVERRSKKHPPLWRTCVVSSTIRWPFYSDFFFYSMIILKKSLISLTYFLGKMYRKPPGQIFSFYFKMECSCYYYRGGHSSRLVLKTRNYDHLIKGLQITFDNKF